MKQFTDIEQSERLREILPIASADDIEIDYTFTMMGVRYVLHREDPFLICIICIKEYKED